MAIGIQQGSRFSCHALAKGCSASAHMLSMQCSHVPPATHLLPLPAATRLDFKSVGEWFKMRLNQEEERQAVGQKRPAEEEAEGQPAPQRLASEGRPAYLGGGIAFLGGSCPCDCDTLLCKAVGQKRPAEEAAGRQLVPHCFDTGLAQYAMSSRAKGHLSGVKLLAVVCLHVLLHWLPAHSGQPRGQSALQCLAREGLHSHLSPGVRPALGGLGSRSLVLRPLQGR